MTKYIIKIKDPYGNWMKFSDTVYDWMSTASYRVVELQNFFPESEFKIVPVEGK